MPTDKTLMQRVIAARKKMSDPKASGKNPAFKSTFVPLDEVLSVVVTPLLDEGVFVSQGVFGDYLVTTAHGEGGDTLTLGEYPVLSDPNPQKFMAAATYAARKSLMLAFGFRGDEDDDGNTAAQTASHAPTKASAAPAPAAATSGAKMASKAQVAGIRGFVSQMKMSPDDAKLLLHTITERDDATTANLTHSEAERVVAKLTELHAKWSEDTTQSVIEELGATEVAK